MVYAHKDEIVMKYFVLPLYNIPSITVKDIYMNALFNKEGTFLFLNLKEDRDFSSNPFYNDTFSINNTKYNLFVTPECFQNDILLIIEGKYSQISKLAKDRILQLSGLAYKQKTVGGIFTAYPLMALFKFPAWKEIVELEMTADGGTRVVLDKDAELLSKLTQFAFIENVIEE